MLKYIFLIVLIFLNIIPIASADEWKEIGWWDVGPLNNDDSSCRMYANYNGLEFYLDYSDKSKEYLFEIVSQDWQSLVVDNEYVLDVEFDQSEWTLPTIARIIENENKKYYGLYYLSKGSKIEEFVEDFQKSTSIRISFDENEIAFLDLKSTYKAVEEIKSCSSRQYSLNNVKDPFANKTKPKQPGKLDPFR